MLLPTRSAWQESSALRRLPGEPHSLEFDPILPRNSAFASYKTSSLIFRVRLLYPQVSISSEEAHHVQLRLVSEEGRLLHLRGQWKRI